MVTKGTENHVAETETPVEEIKVPHQKDKPTLEIVDDSDIELSFAEKAKGLLRNKKFLAGVSSVVLIAAGVLVVKKRNENVSEDEVTTD